MPARSNSGFTASSSRSSRAGWRRCQPADAARIPITDEGLLRGDGAFEATRLYGGRPFALEEHLARLQRSLAGLRLEADLDALRTELAALVRQCAFCYPLSLSFSLEVGACAGRVVTEANEKARRFGA